MEINNQFQLDKLKYLIERNKTLKARLKIAEKALKRINSSQDIGYEYEGFSRRISVEALEKMEKIK